MAIEQDSFWFQNPKEDDLFGKDIRVSVCPFEGGPGPDIADLIAAKLKRQTLLDSQAPAISHQASYDQPSTSIPKFESFDRVARWSFRAGAAVMGLTLGGIIYAFANGDALNGLLVANAGAWVSIGAAGGPLVVRELAQNIRLPQINLAVRNPFKRS